MDKKYYFILIFVFISNFPSSYGFGFDSASSSCQRVSPRRGRAQLLKAIPCDLTSQTYCNLPGSSYPWHAVRKFVHENQGLMKRMYGNVHQISILKTEIHNNDIDMEELEFRPTSHFTRNNHNNDYSNNDFANESPRRKSRYLHSEYQNSRNNDILNEPYFRPTTTTSTSKANSSTLNTTLSSTESNLTKPSSDSIQNSLKDSIKSNESMENTIKKTHAKSDDDNNLYSNSIYETNTQNTNIQDNIKIVQSPNLIELEPKSVNDSESSTISTTLHVLQNFIVKTNENSNVNKVKNNKLNISKEELMVKIQENLRNINETLIKKQTEQLSKGASSTSTTEDAPIMSKTTTPSNKNFNSINNDKKKMNSKITTMEGQLYQDTVQKESIPVTSFRGVNACPIKEEVVAPFWANNTRGEILALLNLYPFEQYVHFQKCQSEKKQMYCRDGCRCEQQYSLHRLLAYDPHDECRGIFSDWFRFPSCCVCKCYNIPLEFRATSRSPRAQNNEYDDDLIINHNEKDPIDIVRENVHRAIYEHATEDWYRGSKSSKDEFYDINYD